MKNFKKFFHVQVDTSVIVNNIKKYFKNFYFLAKFLSWGADAHCDEKNFIAKFFVYKENQMMQSWNMSVWGFKSQFLVVSIQLNQKKLTFERKHQHISKVHHLYFFVNKKFCNKNFFRQSVHLRSMTRIWPKKKIF